MRLPLVILFATLSLVACGDSEPAPSDGPGPVEGPTLLPPTAAEGFQFSMDAVAPAGSEVWLCAVYEIPIETVSPVNRVHFQQNPGMHHMTLSTPGFTAPKLEPGIYECEGLYTDLMEDLIMFFGSQAGEDIMTLPEGVVANLPPGIDVIHEVHYVNTTNEAVDLYSRVNAYVIPPEEVELGIWGGQVRDETIEIPAEGEHSEWTRCVMNQDVEVHFLASHTHQLGIEFTVAPFDGQEAGEVFYRNTDWHDPKIVQYDPPISLPAGTGFEYSCTWRNPTDAVVNYGLNSTDEMCNLAIVHTPQLMTARCEVVETSDGVLWE